MMTVIAYGARAITAALVAQVGTHNIVLAAVRRYLSHGMRELSETLHW